MFRSSARLIATATTLLLIPQTVLAQDFTSGLIGHWRLDETSGTTASDGSGDGYNGTMTGGLSGTNTSTGQINTGLTFDGTDDYINMGDILLLSGQQSFTLSTWIYFDNDPLTDTDFLIERNNNYWLWWNGGNNIISSSDNMIIFGYYGGSTYNDYKASWTPIAGRWYLVTAVHDASADTATIYVDGAQIGQSTGATNSLSGNSGNNLYIGRKASGGYYTGGNMDDVRLYNRALSAADVAALYTYEGYTCSNPNGETGNIIFNNSLRTLQYCNSTEWVGIGKSSTLSNGLIGHWKLDETSGTTATDSSGDSYNGTMTGGLSGTNTVAGQINTALNFDGVDDYVVSSAGLDLGGNDKATISAWVKHNTATISTKQALVYKDYAQFETFIDSSGRIVVYIRNNLAWHLSVSSPVYTDWNTWHLVTATYDGANVKIYRDGALVATSGAETGNFPSSTSHFRIGRNSSGIDYLNGSVDDARLYNRALSAAEVASLYNQRPSCNATTSGLVGHWNMNETTGATITDTSGNGNNGAWTDGVNNNVAEETLAGQDGTALSFDETNNVVTVPHAASLNISTGYTVSSWVWFDSTAAASPITASLIAKNDGGGWGHGWLVGRVSGGGNIVSGNIRLAVQHDRNISSPNAHYSGWIYPVDTWNYVTVSWDGTNVRYYLNGALIETGTLTAAPNTATGALHIGYGRSNWYTTYHAGRIDDMRLYNRALSDDEIASMYGSLGGTCSVASCGSPYGAIGTITYNTTHHVMQYCDGTNWIAMNRAGNGGGGCSNPTGTAGSLVYNSTYNALQYCEGDQWMGVGNANNILTSGLIGHWRLDETSGTAAVDSSGNGNNGTMNGLTGAANSVPGILSNALDFNGAGNSITIPDNANLDISGSGSIAAWFKSDTNSGWRSIISKATDDNFEKNNYTIDFESGRANCSIGDQAAAHSTFQSTTIFSTGVYYHIACTWDGSNMNIYVNGVLDATAPQTITPVPNNAQISIGAYHEGISDHFDGALDDVRIYNRALSASEILTLYNSY